MIDGPIRRRNPALSFDELAELRDLSQQVATDAVPSLANYRDEASGGYFHVLGPDAPHGNAAGDFSKASTATVVPFLVRTGRWHTSVGDDPIAKAQALVNSVLVEGVWTSAQLPPDNPFTVAFLLELVAALQDVGAALDDAQTTLCRTKLDGLAAGLVAGGGRASVEGELPNSYLTQLCTRVLMSWEQRAPGAAGERLVPALSEHIWDGAIASVHSEIALASAEPGAVDVFELGYGVLLADQFGHERLRPEGRRMLRYGLQVFFDSQREDGGWPRGRRLFSYPEYGNAYCYEFEFLAQLLGTFADSHVLLPYLTNIRSAMTHLTDEAIGLPGGGYGWTSGHHRQLKYPESWSTASAFHVTHLVDRMVAEAVTDAILVDLGEPRLRVTAPPSWDRFDAMLDSPIERDNVAAASAKETLRGGFLEPVLAQRDALLQGKPLRSGTLVSAILYGPPGTSKTSYAKAMARALGWQLISIDPSHLLRNGFDQLQAETSRLFRMLGYAERVVIFFDEIDELVRDRFGKTEEATSRFLTTSMLPRIVKLRESQRVVFLVATNHLEIFDAAIARPGRFDLVVPIMPPSIEGKFAHWPAIQNKFDELELHADPFLTQVQGLTFDEFASVARVLEETADAEAFKVVLADAAERGTLNQPVEGEKTWSDLVMAQRPKIRLGE